ncbi:MAG TPA: RDD family protein [Longimicrobium sp.]|nr:RDD family protein [Longimicrobium sp.]
MVRSNASYVIRPDAFSVHPGLVGVPLARPSRRLAAMLLDLLLVAILAASGGGLLLAGAAAFVFLRFASRFTGTGVRPISKAARAAVRGVGALFLFLFLMIGWNDFTDRLEERDDDEARQAQAPVWERLGLQGEVNALRNARSEAEARRVAPLLAAGFRHHGFEGEDLAEAMRNAAGGGPPWMAKVLADALSVPADSAAAAQRDSLALAYAAAVDGRDTLRADSVRPLLLTTLAADSLHRLRGRVSELEQGVAAVSRELREERERGFVSSLRAWFDDLGIGFGWGGLYFTAFVALFKGQTPGKRVLGVRVVRLNGQPMTFWTSFERFGGYAAGLVTGLLGFAQVYWDRNRQMIHDKIVETVVVREKRGQQVIFPSPPPRG